MNTDTHILTEAAQQIIPGGAEMPVRRFLVIHFTAGASGQSSIDYWRQLANGVCAHLVIDRDGSVIQCRPFNRTAGHAGKSRWRHHGTLYSGLNSCSIGIELANGGDSYPREFSALPPISARHKNGGPLTLWEAYPAAQIAACEAVAKQLVARYHLDDILGHDDIAPTRKNDPGPAFPMRKLREACGFSGLPKES